MLQPIYYLAYGSNLNLKMMNERCPNSLPVGKTILKGYELEFRYYLNIKRSINGELPVGIWKIDPSDISSLDEYEDYPNLYYKEYVEIELYGQKIKALIYIMNKNARELEGPSNDYLDICLDGYKDFDFDSKYIDKALKDLNTLTAL